MPRQAIYKPEFGEMVAQLVGDLSLEQAGYKTGLSSETIRRMKLGKVPERSTLESFAEGLKDRGADISQLRIAAGYDEPTDASAAVELALRKVDNISDDDKQKVLDVVREIEERRLRGER